MGLASLVNMNNFATFEKRQPGVRPFLFAIAQPAGYFVRCGLFDLTLLGNELSFPVVSFTITKQKLTGGGIL